MLFNSLEFMIFLPLVVIAFFATPRRHRWMLLLAASYYFYMCWKAEYVLLLLASTLIDYVAALRMGACSNQRARRPYLFASIVSNLGILFLFKYWNFFADNVRA